MPTDGLHHSWHEMHRGKRQEKPGARLHGQHGANGSGLSELGNRGEAIHQYRKCVETLDAEIGVAPSRETTALAASIVAKLSG